MSDIQNTTGVNNTNDGLALAALVGRPAAAPYYNEVGMVTAGGVCDLRKDVQESRRDVKESEAEIRRDIVKSESDIRADVHDVECNLKETLSNHALAFMNRFTEVEKQALRAEYEAKLTAQQVIKEVNEKVSHTEERLNDKIDHESEELSEQVDHGFEEVQEQFCKMFEEDLKRENRLLRDEIAELRAAPVVS